jgi:hypothetical protein
MGTWDDGLFDNDAALDTLSEIVESVPLSASPAHLAVGVGLDLWMGQGIEGAGALVREHAGLVAALAPAARSRLEEIVGDPARAADAEGSRSDAVEAVVGGYCDGPFCRELLECEGAEEVIEELAHACRERLDELIDVPDLDLYEAAGTLAALGVLVVLTRLGVRTSERQIACWQDAFARIDGATTSERDFWDGYGARVREGFRMLLRPAS